VRDYWSGIEIEKTVSNYSSKNPFKLEKSELFYSYMSNKSLFNPLPIKSIFTPQTSVFFTETEFEDLFSSLHRYFSLIFSFYATT
jgi:hypothetical protein